MRSRPGALAWLLAAAVLALGGHAVLARPGTAFLRSAGEAQWIRRDAPLAPAHRPIATERDLFRLRFDVAAPPAAAPLEVLGFRSFGLRLNGRPIDAQRGGRAWNDPILVDLGPHLREGPNELIVAVSNDRGPPALRARSEALGLATGAHWSASQDGVRWHAAVPVGEREPFEITGAVEASPRALWNALPLLAAAFALGAAASLCLRPRAAQLRWAMFAAWIALCANNLWKLPLGVGFDARHHYEYIAFVSLTGRVPLATDGWQMFQAPLYYLLSAPLFSLLGTWLATADVFRLLRIVPMLCGLAQIELAYRSGRAVFPARNDLQLVTTLVGGFLPINVYSAQVVGNEPLAGCLSALLLCIGFSLLAEHAGRPTLRTPLALGGVLGLALLAKVTALLLAPVTAWLVLRAARRSGAGAARAIGWLGACAAATAAVAGWYYARNWILLGRPFVGGWDASRGIGWWQDPGFRIPSDLLSFGSALTRPLYASLSSFWDGLYGTLWLDGYLSGVPQLDRAPAWNADLLLAMPLVALPATLALGVGLARAARGGDALRLSAVCVALYWTAMLGVFVTVPTYSAVKATYSLGIVPCYAVLIASALERPLAGRAGRALVAGALSAWAVCAGLAYFVIDPGAGIS